MRPRSLGMMLLALAACERGAEKSSIPGAAAASVTAGGSAPAAAGQGTCPRTGHWGECQIRARLDQSGLAPRAADGSADGLPTLAVKPLALMIGSARFGFYVFPDTLSRHNAAASLDTLKFISPSKEVGIRQEATVIQNDNALAILFSRNEHQRERVSDAVSAGPPQP